MTIRMVIRQWKKNVFLSVFVMLQIAAVLFLAVITSAVISDKTRCYTAFSDYFRSDGIFMEAKGFDFECQDSNILKEQLRSADVLACYTVFAGLQEASSCGYIAYDSEIIRRYKPELREGEWLSDDIPQQKVTTLHAVVAGVSAHVGDVIHAVTLEDEVIPIKVVGVLAPDATIVGHTNGTRQSVTDYMQMYTDMGQVTVDGCTILLNHDEILAAQQQYASLISPVMDSVLIKYDKQISQEDSDYNWQYLLDHGYVIYRSHMKEINDISLRNIKAKLYFLIPMLVAFLILLLVSAACGNAILLREQRYDYAILNLCGMRAASCICIHLYYIVSIVILAGLADALVIPRLIQNRLILDTNIRLGFLGVVICMVISMLYILLTLFQTYFAYYRQPIHAILINRFRK